MADGGPVGARGERGEPGMPGSFPLLTLFGIDVFVHWSWLIIFGLLTWSLATTLFPDDWTPAQRWLAGGATSLLFFASVLAHELSHSLVARGRGIPVHSITLFIFGGVSALAAESRSPRDEFWTAIVGPLTSFVAAVLFAAIWVVARAADVRPLQGVAGYLAYINVAVGIFNLLPGYPLDGGRVLRAIVWSVKHNQLEATRIAANAGRVVAALLIGLGFLVIFFTPGLVGGFWFILIGWFLWNAAESSYQQLLVQTNLQGLTIGPLIEREMPRVPPDATLWQLAHDYVLRQNRRAFFVAPEEGEVLGLITLSDLRKVPEEEWERVTVFRAMTPRERLLTVTPRTEVLVALQTMAEHDINQMPVVEGRTLVGLLTRAALIRALQLRQEIGPLRKAK